MNVLQLKDAVRIAPKCRSVRDNKHAIVEMLIQPAQIALFVMAEAQVSSLSAKCRSKNWKPDLLSSHRRIEKSCFGADREIA